MVSCSGIAGKVVIILQLMVMTSADYKTGKFAMPSSPLPIHAHCDLVRLPRGVGDLSMRLRGGKDPEPVGDMLNSISQNMQKWQQDSMKFVERIEVPRMGKEAQQVLSDASRACSNALDAVPGGKAAKNFFLVPWLNFRQNDPILSERVACSVAAVVSYVCVLQLGQGISLAAKISHYTSKGLPASVIGFNSVAVAGLVAGEASHNMYQTLRSNAPRLYGRRPAPSRERSNIDRLQDLFFSLIFYKLILRGAFRTIAPTDLTKPGVFAREWVETRGENYATYGQRVRVGQVGWKRGCHHCGSRFPGGVLGLTKKWICDHQPPNKIVSLGESQRFYPHCRGCSQAQSLTLRGLRSPFRLHWPSGPSIFGASFLSIHPLIDWASDVFTGKKQPEPRGRVGYKRPKESVFDDSPSSFGGLSKEDSTSSYVTKLPKAMNFQRKKRQSEDFDWNTVDHIEKDEVWR
ncbi:hypothetical protein GUITHDRAFT_111380 [Guillardia theta CCMP2712]|uniref:Uncharacterized protein n=2 Tax=Guillardia theta TaxID=55529 RepID=L1J2F1_GUITC|nr:hypothetical protein GUITHDRAFT_111380 [Guillardia theta CCMP2712]EKX42708.1 hypothetical protein GUITHDRAFT_111380 [Guillardia theta CCMP2712]|mmetsp:Transcript_50979/g.159299  ORF Transcript_50979/g.159299 Transcript_50979/m.159299 type:complete len:461 (+) Transcript_50979:187-1569(+)|eukprot:XP_005829688.1 hypothetical protein GUITHDRAFT_111380 [Guillardia theta CCMP2712]